MMLNRNIFPWILTLSVLLLLTLPILLQDGMFMDGMLYATISKNLSHGLGSFWFPHYSKTIYIFFDQQPPLGFGIQAVFFKVFGDGIYVERFYSLICALINAYLIAKVWKLITGKDWNSVSWLPVLLWITIPVCFWTFSNNMLENTMSIFDLLVVWCLLKTLHDKKSIVYFVWAGFFLVCAALTKGVQGTFPLAVPFFYWVTLKKYSFQKMLSYSFLLLCIPVVIIGLILLNNDAYIGLTAYMTNRVANSIANVSEVNNRFYLLTQLAMQLLPLIGFTLVIYFFKQKKFKQVSSIDDSKSLAMFFCLIGISASLPLMVTLEQRLFYLTTSLPYFAIGLTLFSAPLVHYGFSKIKAANVKWLNITSLITLIVVIIFATTKIGKNSRDHDMINDVKLIGKIVPKNSLIGSTKKLWLDWSVQEYLVRKYYICMDDTILPEQEYFVIDLPDEIPSGIRADKVDLPTIKYHLYKKRE